MGVSAALAFAGFVFYSLSQTEPVKVLQPRLEHSDAGVFLTGELKNTGSGAQAIDVEVRYYDSQGRQLAQDTVKIDHLGSGETKEFRGSNAAICRRSRATRFTSIMAVIPMEIDREKCFRA